jgi:L-seryl-tRNA(Ser) seleniumtransferase
MEAGTAVNTFLFVPAVAHFMGSGAGWLRSTKSYDIQKKTHYSHTSMETLASKEFLRSIPSVNELLHQTPIQELMNTTPRQSLVKIIRGEVEFYRKEILAGEHLVPATKEASARVLAQRIVAQVEKHGQFSLCKVINATGIIIHTNLGRAPLPSKALDHLCAIAQGYCNLEYDLERGERGSRYQHVERILRELSGAESAIVVNNNAAAVLVALSALAKSREVVISRGELIEIGGSFRLPDVMVQSGCVLKEVGATNRTRLSDYEQAISEQTALLLRAHTSNYRILGFTEQVPLKQLVELGHRCNLPVMKDLGSGNFMDLSRYGLESEPTVPQTIETGVDVITFSGDKLLGGPQAGIILGKEKYLGQIKRNPLLRAIRVDKFTVATLEVVLRECLDMDSAVHALPVLQMLACPLEEIKKKAAGLFRRLKRRCSDYYEIGMEDDFSQAGGGSLPLQQIPTRVVTLVPRSFSVADLDARLRKFQPPVVARASQERLIIDVRTIFPSEIPIIVEALEKVV